MCIQHFKRAKAHEASIGTDLLWKSFDAIAKISWPKLKLSGLSSLREIEFSKPLPVTASFVAATIAIVWRQGMVTLRIAVVYIDILSHHNGSRY